MLAGVLLLTAWRFVVTARRRGARFVAKGAAAAVLLGLVAGVFVGVGARVGMGVIAVANGLEPSVTLAGSLRVVSTFASFGGLLGVVYGVVFRQPLRRSGLGYGALLTLVTWYPLAQAAAQQLTQRISPPTMVAVSGLVVALMWVPYAVALEALLRRWERRSAARALRVAAA